jgi:uncharacterized membrane protein
MDQYFVVSADNKEYGPVDLAGLLQWVRDGRVIKTTLIRKGAAEPVAAETLPELTIAFSAAPPRAVAVVTAVTLPTEFKSWDFIGSAWELVKPHWLPLAAMFFIMAGMGAVPYLGGCVLFVIAGALHVGINRAILGVLVGKTPTVGMMFEGFDRLGQAFLATLVIGILVCFGLVFLIVPGIILAIMWMFTSLILSETQLDFWPAMQASVELTRGYRWELFCLCLACMVVGILGFLALCVGVFIAEPVIFTALALAYRFLQAKKATATATATA